MHQGVKLFTDSDPSVPRSIEHESTNGDDHNKEKEKMYGNSQYDYFLEQDAHDTKEFMENFPFDGK